MDAIEVGSTGRDRRGRAAVRVAPGAASVVSAARGWRRASAPKASPTSRVAPWRLATPIPGASRRPHRRGVRAGPRTEGGVLRPRRVGGRRHRRRLRRRRPHRRQQRAQLPHGSARAAADSRGQRRSPEAARRAARSRRAGRARSSPIRTARPSCSRWRWRRCAQFDIRAVVVSTMQAVSGAGYPGVPSLDILGNVVPFIGGEEEKMESETLKILGTDGGRTPLCRRRQRAHQPRGGDRRPHHDGLGGRSTSKPSIADDRRRAAQRSAAGRRSWGCRARRSRRSW